MGSQLEQDKYIIEISYFKINAFRLKSINLRNQYCFLKWVKRKKRKGYGQGEPKKKKKIFVTNKNHHL